MSSLEELQQALGPYWKELDDEIEANARAPLRFRRQRNYSAYTPLGKKLLQIGSAMLLAGGITYGGATAVDAYLDDNEPKAVTRATGLAITRDGFSALNQPVYTAAHKILFKQQVGNCLLSISAQTEEVVSNPGSIGEIEVGQYSIDDPGPTSPPFNNYLSLHRSVDQQTCTYDPVN